MIDLTKLRQRLQKWKERRRERYWHDRLPFRCQYCELLGLCRNPTDYWRTFTDGTPWLKECRKERVSMASDNELRKDNARRLAAILDRYAEDRHTVDMLAHYLNYLPEQLGQDMHDIRDYLKELERKIVELGGDEDDF